MNPAMFIMINMGRCCYVLSVELGLLRLFTDFHISMLSYNHAYLYTSPLARYVFIELLHTATCMFVALGI